MTALAVVPNVATETPVLEGRDLTKSFWVKRGRGPARATRPDSMRWMAFRCSSMPGRSPRWSARAGPGRRRSHGCSRGSSNPTPARSCSTVSRSPRHALGSYAAQVQMVFQDPFASLNPVHRVRHHLVRPLQIHHIADGDVDEAVLRAAAPRGARPARQVHRQVSARALRRPASASRDRARAGGPSSRAARRRAGVDARRVDPSRACSTCSPIFVTASASQSSTSRTTSRRRATSPTPSWSCTQASWSSRHRASSLTDSPAHPYTQLLLSAAPDPERLEPPTLAGSRCAAEPACAAEPGVAFIPAARTRWRSASARRRRPSTVSPGHSPRAGCTSIRLRSVPRRRSRDQPTRASGASLKLGDLLSGLSNAVHPLR